MSKIDSNIIFDPHRVILDLKDLMSDKGHIFDTATPLGMVMEAIGYTTSTAMQEIILNNRKLYPSLSNDYEDLYRHITDDEEKDMYASPSEAYMSIYVNINDIMSNSISKEVPNAGATRYKFGIAKNSTITVAKTTFTIMDDIKITLLVDKNNNKSLSVLYDANDASYVYTGIGGLPSDIIVSEGIEWGVFQIPVKQLDVTQYKINIVKNSVVDMDVPIEDQYVYSEVYIRSKDGIITKLNKIFSKDVIDIKNPSILISAGESKVNYTIPKPYIYQGKISGELYVYTYTTKGKIELPLGEFENKDFAFKLFTFNKDLEFTVTSNITIITSSNYIVDTGVNRRPFKDVRNKVIEKSKGNIVSPTSNRELKEYVKNKGFTIHKVLDTITDRNYTATRSTSIISVSPLETDIDVFLDEVNLSKKYIDGIIDSDGNNIYIKEGSLFKLTSNGIIPYLFVPGNKFDDIVTLNKDEIFISPLAYTISYDKNIVETKVYDLRKPSIDKISILKRNNLLLVNCNINSYRLIKTKDGFVIYFELVGNSAFKNIEKDAVIQLGFVNTSGTPVYYETAPYKVLAGDTIFAEFAGKTLHKVTVATDFKINNGLKLTNDLDDSNSLTNIPLNPIVNISIYTKAAVTNHLTRADAAVAFEKSTLYKPDNKIVITTEKISMKLGEEVKHLWNKAYALYNKDRYRRYTKDIYKTYTEDVYRDFDGCSFKIEDTTGNGICDKISKELLHSKGEYVLIDDKKVIEHSKDSIVYLNGKPVEGNYGIDIFADIVLLDYRYNYLNLAIYDKHIEYTLNKLIKWCNTDLKEINENLLERTSILFRPNKNTKPVHTKFGTLDSKLKPKVEIYYKDDVSLELDHNNLTKLIGKALAIYFSKVYIDINDLEKNLLDIIPDDALSVKVTYGKDENIIKISSYNRFRINKKINNANELVYDIDVVIKRI